MAKLRWCKGSYLDGWVEPLALLDVEGSTKVSIWAYLPKNGDQAGKTISISWREGKLSWEVERGVAFELGPIELKAELARLVITTSPEDNSKSGDLRNLGFVVHKLVVDGVEAHAARGS